MPHLSFDFTCAQAEQPAPRLPVYKAFENASSVAVNNPPVGPVFDCTSLLQFSGLKHLDLTGNMTNLNALAGLKSLNRLKKEKEMDFSSVTKLRKSIWFVTEYGIPFFGWEDKNGKIATKAYKLCMKEIKKQVRNPNCGRRYLGSLRRSTAWRGLKRARERMRARR